MKSIARSAVITLAGLAFAASAVAGTFQVQSGGVGSAIPEPQGLVAMKKTSARYFTFTDEIQGRSGNRLVAALLEPADARAADAGEMPSPEQWALVFSNIKMGSLKISVREFKGAQNEIIAGLEKAFGGKFADNVNSHTDAAVGKLLKDLGAPGDAVKLRVGSVQPLGLYAREDNHITYGAAARVTISTGTTTEEIPIVMMITMVSAKDRLLNFACYRRLNDRADIDAAKAPMASWMRDFLKANK